MVNELTDSAETTDEVEAFVNQLEANFEEECLRRALGSKPSMTHAHPPAWFRCLKRCSDVAFSLVGLIVLSPLFLCVCIIVKITSPGPVVFSQLRYGKDKRPFVCYKFRSMRVDTPSNIPSRVMGERNSVMTPVGAVLRKTSIDELPQLWNVLKGDMSLVGPRPMIIAECDQVIARDFYGANDIRPGITGWAQVNGRDGLSVEEKARFDGEYRESIGLAMDCRVLFRSVVVVLGRIGYAEDESTTLRSEMKTESCVQGPEATPDEAVGR